MGLRPPSQSKDFTSWHTLKSEIQTRAHRANFEEREIWFCYLGLNLGFEQDGGGADRLRPVIIIKKFSHEVFWGVPLTSATKRLQHPYYFQFQFTPDQQSTAILTQLRLLDSMRLKYRTGSLTDTDFQLIKSKITQLIA